MVTYLIDCVSWFSSCSRRLLSRGASGFSNIYFLSYSSIYLELFAEAASEVVAAGLSKVLGILPLKYLGVLPTSVMQLCEPSCKLFELGDAVTSC